MNSIESLKSDFNSQIEELNNIHNTKLFDDCIYVGSGDSYVAGLIVEYLTNHRCRCYSPSDLFKSESMDNGTYCFISVTGKTKANIKVAQRASEAGVRTVAITLNNNSPLARACKELVPLKIIKSQTPTAGFSTFVANVVTSLQIAGVAVPSKFEMWHKNGVKLSQDLLSSFTLPNRSVYVLGNNLLYPISLYASMQIAEFFGKTAISHKLEEFCHSPIFGLDKSDCAWILGQNEGQVSEILRSLNFSLSYVELYNKDIFAQLFTSIFFIQNLILLLAEKYGYTELQYVMMQDVLKVSSGIIYGQSG
jgi:fructoselysine-6-P-deglycase FrlB-like protein